jgi:hypothetical protein
MGNIFEEYFAELPAPRVERTKRHKLLDIVAIAIGGADNWGEIEELGSGREGWLSEFLELPNGIPSPDTFGRRGLWRLLYRLGAGRVQLNKGTGSRH